MIYTYIQQSVMAIKSCHIIVPGQVSLFNYCIFNPLSDTFFIPSWYLFWGLSWQRNQMYDFPASFLQFRWSNKLPFDFISWHNPLNEFYGNDSLVDAICCPVPSQKLKCLICVILHQTHFLQVLPTHNIMSHTLKGLSSRTQYESFTLKNHQLLKRWGSCFTRDVIW